MAKVLGIGGLFFRSKDPERITTWYQTWLGFPASPHGIQFSPAAMPEGASTVWAPFPDDTDYLGQKDWMMNLVVDDLDAALRQVAEGGATVLGEVESYDFGRFGRFVDPDGNRVELWEPAKKAPAS